MQALFAQPGNFNNAGNANGPPDEFLIIVLVVVGILVLVFLVVYIFFLITLQKALGRCRPGNRTMEPAMVWLNLVPCLSIVWQFITVNRVAESLSNEFYERGFDRGGEDYGRGLGTTACVLNLLGAIPYIGGLFGLGALICGCIYWVKIAGFSRQLAADHEYAREDDYEDDDRPRRRRRRSDDYEDDYDRDDRSRRDY